MQGRLCIARYMRNDTLEYLRLVRIGSRIRILVLELQLFAAKVVSKAMELAALVFFTIFILKGVAFNALPHNGGILVQNAAHGVTRRAHCLTMAQDLDGSEMVKQR